MNRSSTNPPTLGLSSSRPPIAEIIELRGNSGRSVDNAIELQPGGGPLQILESTPSPMQLELVLQIDPHRDTSQIAISMAQFITAIQCDSGKRNLIYDTIRSSASSGIVTLVFRLPALGTHSSEMLQSLIDFATNTAEAFQGASLQRASVATRN